MGGEIFGYLDHNILDTIRKGDPHNIAAFLKRSQIKPIYSKENLKEIKRSVGSEEIFVSVLSELDAKFIEPVSENRRLTGAAQINGADAAEIWKWYLENEDPLPEYGYGLTSMLEKFYGGRQGESYEEVLSKGNDELVADLNGALKNMNPEDLVTKELEAVIEILPSLLKEQYQQIITDWDRQEQPPIKQFEEVTGLGARVLKNIEPPDVVEKVFDAVKNSMPNIELDIDSFFGITSLSDEAKTGREKTQLEKVNSIYHQLNYLGYYRDSGIKTRRGFIRFSSDMTHAGMASFCHLLLSRDTGLVKKASAAYKYLGVKTQILHFHNCHKS